MKNEIESPESKLVKQKLYEETALIAWKDLQRFFAQGVVMWVDNDCDLVETGTLIVEDQVKEIEELMASARFVAVSNAQAKKWFELDASLWSLVVAPFVLVQERTEENTSSETI